MTEDTRRKVQGFLQIVGGGDLNQQDEIFFDLLYPSPEGDCEILNGTLEIMNRRVSQNMTQSINMDLFQIIADKIGGCTLSEGKTKPEKQVRFCIGIPKK